MGKREHLGISPSEMARRLNLQRGRYNNYEKGRRQLPMGIVLDACKILGCDVADLLLEESPPENNLR